jgi:hypothetical protein
MRRVAKPRPRRIARRRGAGELGEGSPQPGRTGQRAALCSVYRHRRSVGRWARGSCGRSYLVYGLPAGPFVSGRIERIQPNGRVATGT